MPILSDQEIQFLADAIVEEFDGELLGVDQNTKTFRFAFADSEKMLTLIQVIKSDKNLSRFARINSKFIGGRHILTLDPS